MLSEIKDVVDLVLRMNFKRLMTIFNVVLILFALLELNHYTSCKVQEAVSSQGAAKTQCGFIVNKIQP